jgi:hypothetical protein
MVGTRLDGPATVLVVAGLMLVSAAVVVRQVDDGFQARYTALDLRHPEGFVADPSIVGPSTIGMLQWRGAEPLVVRGVSVRQGDLLKAKVFAECDRGELVLRVGSGPALRIPARARWRQVELTLANDGTEIRWEKATPQPCPVHFSRMTVAGFHGEATGLVEAHLVAGRAKTPTTRWDPRLTSLLSPLVVFGLVWMWEALVIRAPRRRARRVAALAAGVPVLVLAAFEVAGHVSGLWLVMASRTPLVLFAVAVIAVVAVSAGVRFGPRLRRLPRGFLEVMRAVARDLGSSRAEQDPASAADGGAWRVPRRALLVFGLAVCVLLAVFAVTVVQDFRGPMLGHGDLDQWLHESYYFGHNLSLRPWPWLDFDNDQLFFPYGGCNVFQPWVFEMNAWVAVQNRLFGLGPWLQTYFLFSILVTGIGAFLILVREHSAGRAALLAAALGFANYYAIAKFPGHMIVACVHWAALGILLDAIMVRRHCAGRRWSARLVALRALVLFLSLSLDLGYVAGVALTSFLVSAGFIAVRAVLADRAALGRLQVRAAAARDELLESFRAHKVQVASLAIAAAVAGAFYGPLVLEVRSAASRFDFHNVPIGMWWANPARMLIPVLPFFNPVRDEWLFNDSHEGLFAASPGAFFVLAALLGVLVAGRRRLSTVPALVALALFLTFHGYDRPWLKVLPWFSFARVSGRFSALYPALLVAVSLAVPDSLFRRRTGRVVGLLGAALLAVEAATAYQVCFTRPKRFWTPDPPFLAMMATIRESPGAAVLDWPFCIAGGNGIGTGEVGRFYGLQAGISSLQVFHGKKIMSTYFGRLHPDQFRAYRLAGWPRLFLPDNRDCGVARRQRRDFLPWEWAFLEEFVKSNDFAGIVLYTDILPPETVAGFHARFGGPVAAARGEPYGAIEFIPKRREWQALVDPALGRQLRLENRLVPWPPNQLLRMDDPGTDDWLREGWDGTNTEGHLAEVAFALDRIEPLYWSIRVRPYGRQRMSVELNGHDVFPTKLLRGKETVMAPLPVELLRRQNRIVLRLPDARSPKSVGYNGDTRVLGIEAEWMQLGRHRYAGPPIGERLAMDRRKVEDFLGPGWGKGEPEFAVRSTRGHAASIRFGLDEIRPLSLGLEVETVESQRVTVELNGVRLWTGRGDGAWVTANLALPAAALRPDNELVFLLPDAHSRKSVGRGLDDRVLGLAVRWIQFNPGSP